MKTFIILRYIYLQIVIIHSWVGRCGPAPHTLTVFKTNIADFPTLFKTEFRFLIPRLRHLTQNHTLCMTIQEVAGKLADKLMSQYPVQYSLRSRHKAVEDQKSSEGTKFPHGATLLWQDVQMTACSWLVTYRK